MQSAVIISPIKYNTLNQSKPKSFFLTLRKLKRSHKYYHHHHVGRITIWRYAWQWRGQECPLCYQAAHKVTDVLMSE